MERPEGLECPIKRVDEDRLRLNRCWGNQDPLRKIHKNCEQVHQETSSQPSHWKTKEVVNAVQWSNASCNRPQQQGSAIGPLILGRNPEDSGQQVRDRQVVQVTGPNWERIIHLPEWNHWDLYLSKAGADLEGTDLGESMQMAQVRIHDKGV